jgi:tetratricopeptide (TPR) repeat protein
MKRVCLSLLFALLCDIGFVLADPASKFDQGLHLFREGKNAEAIAVWQSVLAEGVASGATYYNLANAYYRAGEIGTAILNYERAKRLLPRDTDIANNLDLARLGTVDKFDTAVRLVIWQWVDKLRDSLALYELARILIIVSILTATALTGLLLVPGFLRQYMKTAFLALLILFIFCGAWYGWRSSLDARTYGVVLAMKSDVYSAPDDGSTQLFTIHEGTKVRMREKLTDWVNILLPDGRQGWIPFEDLGRI